MLDRRVLVLIVCCATVMVVLLMPLPPMGREARALTDLCHAPLFGLLALVVLYQVGDRFRRSPWRTLPAIWVGVVAFGGMMELCQSVAGRSASWDDLWANALGAGGFLLAACAWNQQGLGERVVPAALAAAIFLTGIYKPVAVLADAWMQPLEMPLLASFEHAPEWSRWRFQRCVALRSEEHVTQGSSSLELKMGRGPYVGAALIWPSPDWFGYQQLAFDLFVPTGPPLDLIVKIEDAQCSGEDIDRFHRALHLEPGPHRVCIPLVEIQNAPRDRRLDLHEITVFIIFTIDPPSERTLFFDNLHLEGKNVDAGGWTVSRQGSRKHEITEEVAP